MTNPDTPAEQILKMCAEMVDLRGKATKHQWINPAMSGTRCAICGSLPTSQDPKYEKNIFCNPGPLTANHVSQMARALAVLVEALKLITNAHHREVSQESAENIAEEALTEAAAILKEGPR